MARQLRAGLFNAVSRLLRLSNGLAFHLRGNDRARLRKRPDR
jgi:hypothetical protein